MRCVMGCRVRTLRLSRHCEAQRSRGHQNRAPQHKTDLSAFVPEPQSFHLRTDDWHSGMMRVCASKCQSPGCLPQLRKCTGHEDRTVLSPSPTLAYQKYHVLSALQSRGDLGEIVFGIYGLLVDFQNDISAREPDVVRERTRLHVLHNHAFARWNIKPVGDLCRHGSHRQSQLALFWCCFLCSLVFFAESGSEQLRAVTYRDRRVLLLAITHELDLHLASGFAAGNVSDQFIAILYALPIDRNDRVPDLQPGFIRRCSGNDIGNRDAAIHPVHSLDRWILLRRKLNSNRSARYTMLRSDQLVINVYHCIRRQCEAHARVRVRIGQDRRINSNNFSSHVHQRSAGVPGIDRRVRLNERLELAIRHNIAPFGRDNACRDRLLQTKRTADCQHPIAYLHALGVAQLSHRQWLVANVNFDNRQIGLRIRANDLRVMQDRPRLAVDLHANTVCLFDNVTIGDNVALRVHNYAGAQGVLTDWSLLSLPAKEAVEEVLKRILIVSTTLVRWSSTPSAVRILDRRFGVDIHHRRFQLLGNLRKLVGELLWRRDRQGSRRVRSSLAFLAPHTFRNHGSNENSDRQRGQDGERVGHPVGLYPHPEITSARIHTFASSDC